MSHKLHGKIGTPAEAHAVTSAAEYRALAARHLARAGLVGALHDDPAPLPAFVSAGRWLVMCPCGNGPSAHPGGAEGWPEPVAVCFECGAVYRPVFPPLRAAAEEVLLARPHFSHRHWFPDPASAGRRGLRPERVEDLVRENRARGVAVRRSE